MTGIDPSSVSPFSSSLRQQRLGSCSSSRVDPAEALASKRTLTITEAAEATGLSRKAIARRVERGSLRSVLRGRQRLIPRAELVRAGLIAPEGKTAERDFEPLELLAPAGALDVGQPPHGEEPVLAALLRELVGRLERQAGEIAHHRALTARAESLRLEAEISELSARLRRLESAQVLALESGPVKAPRLDPASPAEDRTPGNGPRPSGEAIWLPPSVTDPTTRRQRGPVGERLEAEARGRPSAPVRQRLIPLVVEAVFLVSVAALAWRAALRPALVVAAMATSWLLVAIIEWIRWTRQWDQS